MCFNCWGGKDSIFCFHDCFGCTLFFVVSKIDLVKIMFVTLMGLSTLWHILSLELISKKHGQRCCVATCRAAGNGAISSTLRCLAMEGWTENSWFHFADSASFCNR